MTTTSRSMMTDAPGRPTMASRSYVFVVVTALMLTSVGVRTSDGTQDQDVRVDERGGLYTVTAAFPVSASPAIVVATLTDYEEIPVFMPDVRSSHIIERGEGGRVVVRQEAVAKVLLFSRRVHLELEIDERPGLITFRDRSGVSFVRYEGRWDITADGETARVRYELVAKPTASVPAFLIRRLLGSDARQTILLLTSEMVRRAMDSGEGAARR